MVTLFSVTCFIDIKAKTQAVEFKLNRFCAHRFNFLIGKCTLKFKC